MRKPTPEAIQAADARTLARLESRRHILERKTATAKAAAQEARQAAAAIETLHQEPPTSPQEARQRNADRAAMLSDLEYLLTLARIRRQEQTDAERAYNQLINQIEHQATQAERNPQL